MKTIFKIFPERKLVLTCFTGTINFKDVINWFDAVQKHQGFSQEFSGVVDLRKGVFGRILDGKTVQMAEKAKELADYMISKDFTRAKWAILADTPMETSLMLVYSNSASQKHPIRIFSTIQAAEEYLGVALADAFKELST